MFEIQEAERQNRLTENYYLSPAEDHAPLTGRDLCPRVHV